MSAVTLTDRQRRTLLATLAQIEQIENKPDNEVNLYDIIRLNELEKIVTNLLTTTL